MQPFCYFHFDVGSGYFITFPSRPIPAFQMALAFLSMFPLHLTAKQKLSICNPTINN